MDVTYKPEPKTDRLRAGLVFRLASFWIGLHYSRTNRRLCFNIIPCVTVFVTLKDGDLPKLSDYPWRWVIL